MKKYFAILTMMVLAVAACKKQDPVEKPIKGGEVITAHIGGPDSKVEFDPSSGQFSWNTPDGISIHTSEGGYKSVEVNSTGVFTFYPNEGEVRDGFAFYPASAAGGTVDTPVVVLPSSYDIDAEGMGNWYPTPMIAVNDPDDPDLWFYHVGGSLRLTLNNVPAGTAKIVIGMGKGITGNFSVYADSSMKPMIKAGDSADELTFNLSEALSAEADGLILNIPLPTGTYPGVDVAAKSAADATLASGSISEELTFPRTRGRQRTLDL